jgi:Fur family transcriptional regulator, iron response regulator
MNVASATSRRLVCQSVGVRESGKMKSSSADLESARIYSETYSPAHHRAIKAKLRGAGLRPTRTRIALGHMLFAQGNRHVSAEMLFAEASLAEVSVSLATVYNTLHEFTKVGFLRQVAIDSSKLYFDTNNTEHQHFFLEDRHELMDIPQADVAVGKIPSPPEGYEITRIDVVVRLRRKRIEAASEVDDTRL